METLPFWMPIAFFLVALFYAAVGFGGGSSYVAILALSGLSFQGIAPTALICNIIVTAGGLWHFSRGGHLRLKTVLPFASLSIPMAYLGGRLPVEKELFCFLLGLSLLAVAVRMLIPSEAFRAAREISWKQTWTVGLPAGSLLGFLAGLVGIGGGIFLSPLLLFMRWANIKEAAASASFFILVNSTAGLAGQLQKGAVRPEILLPLALAVFIGGQIGSRLGSYRIPKIGLQRALAALILYASGKLLLGI